MKKLSPSQVFHAKRVSERGPQELFKRINKYVSKKEPEVEPCLAQKQSKIAICNRPQKVKSHRGDSQLQLRKEETTNLPLCKAIFSSPSSLF